MEEIQYQPQSEEEDLFLRTLEDHRLLRTEVEGRAKPSFILDKSIQELYVKGDNCKFASNWDLNVLYCDKGKIFVQDAHNSTRLNMFELPTALTTQITSTGLFKFFRDETNKARFFVQIDFNIYTF